MVDYVTDANELARRVREWSFTAPITPLKTRIQSIPGVTADLICDAAEIMYAHHDELDDKGKRAMGEAFNYADKQGWTAFNKEGRSKKIVEHIAFELGDRSTKPAGDLPEPEKQRRNGIDFRKPDEKPAPDEPGKSK